MASYTELAPNEILLAVCLLKYENNMNHTERNRQLATHTELVNNVCIMILSSMIKTLFYNHAKQKTGWAFVYVNTLCATNILLMWNCSSFLED